MNSHNRLGCPAEDHNRRRLLHSSFTDFNYDLIFTINSAIVVVIHDDAIHRFDDVILRGRGYRNGER